jgi:site-specific DNA-methyltransferase (cytosine-N4-specific)
MWWLGYDPLFVKQHEIGARPHFFKKNHHGPDDFKEQMSKVFALLSPICARDAYVCFVLGNSKIHGKIIDNTELLITAAQQEGFMPRAVLPRNISFSHKSFNLAHARIQSENIVVLQRQAVKKNQIPVHLKWHEYQYFPYERKFAFREIAALPGLVSVKPSNDGITAVLAAPTPNRLQNLVYFSHYSSPGGLESKTLQAMLENGATTNGTGKKQSTRYSIHGLHEYKGKFNPQVVRGILNWFNLPPTAQFIDPFCGSGTALVEAIFAGHPAYGWDLNPFAVFLTNVKLQALQTSPAKLRIQTKRIIAVVEHFNLSNKADTRTDYLKKWFSPDIFKLIEQYRNVIDQESGENAPIFKVILSDLLRDYSHQEPSDLRIRRRMSPFPSNPLPMAYQIAADRIFKAIEHTHDILGDLNLKAASFKADGRYLGDVINKSPVNLSAEIAITSPPYATALPYIDTQRLSLVWLGLISPEQIAQTEESLIGSREASEETLRKLRNLISENGARLPEPVLNLCSRLQSQVNEKDGFRRRAVPGLLYRYFTDMKKTFATVFHVMKPRGYYVLIVGTNRTTIGGKPELIDTPTHLLDIAVQTGWTKVENLELETYKRYGLHAANAVQEESLLVMQK